MHPPAVTGFSNWPTSAPAHCKPTSYVSVSRSAGRFVYALTMSAMRLNALPCTAAARSLDPLALLARLASMHCIEYRESYPTSHVLLPHGPCRTVHSIGAGWPAGLEYAQITGQASKYPQQANPRSPLQRGLVQRYLNPHGTHPSCPHSDRHDSLHRLILSCRSSVAAV